MWNVYSYNKRFTVIIVITFLVTIFNLNFNKCFDVSYAYNEVVAYESSDSNKQEEIEKELKNNIDNILEDIESDELDDFIQNDFDLEFLNSLSFIDLVKNILSNNYFNEYDSISTGILCFFKDNILSLFSFFLSIFILVVLNEMFASFCIDKYGDVKVVVRLIFSIIIVLQIIIIFKDLSDSISNVIERIFDFSRILFPILLSLILISGSNGTYTIYTTLSTFLIETGSYIFVYILYPLVTSIVMISVLKIVFKDNKFEKLISFFKMIFKYIIIIFFAIFGLFSLVNVASSSLADGVNYKLTKFAIKTYIPVLGGYISDGFDFVHTCSVLIKNSFGICGIIVLFFIILKPLLICFVYMFMFKLLSVLVSFIGKTKYANYFDDISSGLKYFMTVLVGIFMCMFIYIYLLILAVSVV